MNRKLILLLVLAFVSGCANNEDSTLNQQVACHQGCHYYNLNNVIDSIEIFDKCTAICDMQYGG